MTDKRQFTCLAFQVKLISCTLLLILYCYEATPIRLSPLGMVSVCPGGQVLLTCERMSGSVSYWNISIPHPMATALEVIVTSQGVLLSSGFKRNFTEFNITLTSESPLTSQLLINNVTTEINGSTIYCSEDGNENNAPITVINVKYKDDVLRSMDHSLNVTMVNQLFRSDDVTVTLQWPREPGAVYNVSISPETPHSQLTNTMIIIMINLTISYNIQHDVSIVSSLCGVTTTKVLNYVTCDYPPMQLLRRPVVEVSGSQDSHPLTEGQFITYTCHPGFTMTGPNMSVCTGNREWEPDPGEVDCIADHGCRVPLVNRYVKLNFSSTLVLTLTCENEKLTSTTDAADEQVLKVICHSNTNTWYPDPTDFIESCSSFYLNTVPAETSQQMPVVQIETANNIMMVLITVIIIILLLCMTSSIVFLSIGYACGWFSHKHKQSCTSKAEDENNTGPSEGSQLPPTPGPLYEELLKSAPEHQDLVELKENVAYGPIVK